MDAMVAPTAVRFKIWGQAYVIEPIALSAAKTEKDMEPGIGSTSDSMPSRRPRERPSGNQQPPYFALENSTFRNVLGPGSAAGAAYGLTMNIPQPG
ncbi:MAG: hypothetical protein JJ902_13375 [Roseibium sp.]|nr:hypothetical protein [Roseibium sp.]